MTVKEKYNEMISSMIVVLFDKHSAAPIGGFRNECAIPMMPLLCWFCMLDKLQVLKIFFLFYPRFEMFVAVSHCLQAKSF